LTDVIAAKPKFDGLVIVSPTTLLNLKLEKKGSDAFGSAVVEKIPEALQGYVFLSFFAVVVEIEVLVHVGTRADFYRIAQGLLAPIDASFDEAIAVYE
jgi:hypothetical protein